MSSCQAQYVTAVQGGTEYTFTYDPSGSSDAANDAVYLNLSSNTDAEHVVQVTLKSGASNAMERDSAQAFHFVENNALLLPADTTADFLLRIAGNHLYLREPSSGQNYLHLVTDITAYDTLVVSTANSAEVLCSSAVRLTDVLPSEEPVVASAAPAPAPRSILPALLIASAVLMAAGILSLGIGLAARKCKPRKPRKPRRPKKK